jgi:murein DD-endopeptidase MepM/ murein hydrolase activator NlpD
LYPIGLLQGEVELRRTVGLCVFLLVFFVPAFEPPPPSVTTNGGHLLNAWRKGACRGTFHGEPGSGSFVWPVPEHARWISGYRFRDARYARHGGVDFGAWWGSPVYAADSGVVVFGGWWGARGFGNLVVVDHLNGWQTWYGHLSGVSVKCGQQVEAGYVIGRAGSTGWSTGSHLHFEIRRGGVPVDPLTLLED